MKKTIELKRTNSRDSHFVNLVGLLDKELKIRDGDDHEFYHQFNGLEHIKFVVVAYVSGKEIGCGAIKQFDPDIVEIKRMYVSEKVRGKGIASLILNELEDWAGELEYSTCILETGLNQPEAIRLYEKNKYKRIQNYGQYKNVETSLCFQKTLKYE